MTKDRVRDRFMVWRYRRLQQSNKPVSPYATALRAQNSRTAGRRPLGQRFDRRNGHGPPSSATELLVIDPAVRGAGHQGRPGEDDHTRHKQGERQDLETDPQCAAAQNVSKEGDAEHDADQRVGGHQGGARRSDGSGVQRALKQKDSSNADDRKHVWLEVAEDSAPAVVQVGRNRLGQS